MSRERDDLMVVYRLSNEGWSHGEPAEVAAVRDDVALAAVVRLLGRHDVVIEYGPADAP